MSRKIKKRIKKKKSKIKKRDVLLLIGGFMMAIIIIILISNYVIVDSTQRSDQDIQIIRDSSNTVYGSDVYRNSYNQRLYEKKYREERGGWGDSYDRIIRNKQDQKPLKKLNSKENNNK